MESSGRKKNVKEVSLDKYLNDAIANTEFEISESAMEQIQKKRRELIDQHRMEEYKKIRAKADIAPPLYKFDEPLKLIYPNTQIELVCLPYYGERVPDEEEIWKYIGLHWTDYEPWKYSLKGYIKPINMNTATFKPEMYSGYVILEDWDSGSINSKHLGSFDFEDYIFELSKANSGGIYKLEKENSYLRVYEIKNKYFRQDKVIFFVNEADSFRNDSSYFDDYNNGKVDLPEIEIFEYENFYSEMKTAMRVSSSTHHKERILKFLLRRFFVSYLSEKEKYIPTKEEIKEVLKYYQERYQYMINGNGFKQGYNFKPINNGK